MKVYAFRAEPYMIELVDKLAWELRTTRSAVIRKALVELVARYNVNQSLTDWRIKRVVLT